MFAASSSVIFLGVLAGSLLVLAAGAFSARRRPASSRLGQRLTSRHYRAVRTTMAQFNRDEVEEAITYFLRYLGLDPATNDYHQVRARLQAAADTDSETFQSVIAGLTPDTV